MQKTAYEMRISDWSSDVCSSDLRRRHRFFRARDDARAAFHPVWRPQIAERDDCRRKECADAPRDRARQHARYFGNLARAEDRKSTRLNSVTNAHIVCRLLLETKYSEPVLLKPKATSTTSNFDILTVTAVYVGFYHCIYVDTLVKDDNHNVTVC